MDELTHEVRDALDRVRSALVEAGWDARHDPEDPDTIQVYDEQMEHFIALSASLGSEPE